MRKPPVNRSYPQLNCQIFTAYLVLCCVNKYGGGNFGRRLHCCHLLSLTRQ